jgi:hypothetical protein
LSASRCTCPVRERFEKFLGSGEKREREASGAERAAELGAGEKLSLLSLSLFPSSGAISGSEESLLLLFPFSLFLFPLSGFSFFPFFKPREKPKTTHFSFPPSFPLLSFFFDPLKSLFSGVRVANFFGGLPIKQHKDVLRGAAPPHIVVGTPGRVKQLAKEGDLKLGSLRHFVIDECDKVRLMMIE